MKKSVHRKEIYFGFIFIIWLIFEEQLRNFLLCDEQVLFVVDSIPIALYSLLGYIIVLLLSFFAEDKVKRLIENYFIAATILLLVIPFMFICVRTEVTVDSVKLYDMWNNCKKEYSIEEINRAEMEIEYYENGPSRTQFNYRLCFEDYSIELSSTFRLKYWEGITAIDDALNEKGIVVYHYGKEYIQDIRNYNTYDILMNYMYGVYTNIEKIEELMKNTVGG